MNYILTLQKVIKKRGLASFSLIYFVSVAGIKSSVLGVVSSFFNLPKASAAPISNNSRITNRPKIPKITSAIKFLSLKASITNKIPNINDVIPIADKANINGMAVNNATIHSGALFEDPLPDPL